MTRASLRALAAGLALAMTGGLAVAHGPAALADETYPRPADGVVSLRGHGWGHGNGMSQYGALGGAQAGASAAQIVATYYPGTTLSSIGNPTIRVRVASLGSSIAATPAPGLAVTWDGSAPQPLPSTLTTGTGTTSRTDAVTAWRLTPDPAAGSSRVRVEALAAGTWRLWATSPGSSAILVNPTSGLVTTSRSGTAVTYRGQLRGVRVSAGAALTPVVALPMDSYLRSVVPSEMPASWPAAAIGAQAIAARSFAEYHRRYAPLTSTYDVYDDTRSQVFSGTRVGSTSREYASADAAVAATAGQALTYAGSVAFTQFSSSSGGWTSDGGKPYLSPRRDPWDAVAANPNHTWTAEVPVSRLEAAYPSIGRYRGLRVDARTGLGEEGGRVTRATVLGSAGSVSTTGNGLRSALGLKSDWFVPTDTPASYPRDHDGDGLADVLAVHASTGELRLYPTDGRGGWRPMRVLSPAGWDAYTAVLSAGAWDGDALSDLMLRTSAGNLYLRRADGRGSFSAPEKIGTGWQALDQVVPAGDVDGDGRADLLARRRTDGALVLYRGDGAGGFASWRLVGTGWQGFTTILGPGDLDGDGRMDVLARTASGALYLYPGDGTGGWRPRRLVGTGWQGFTALTALGDVDGDRRGDVLARSSAGTLLLYPGDGAGGWLPRRTVGTGWQVFSTIAR